MLHLISSGMTNSEAAQELAVSVHAVKFHLGAVYDKLGVSNRTEAAAAYFRHFGHDQDGSSTDRHDLQAALAYWRKRLRGAATLDVPSDRRAEAGAGEACSIERELGSRRCRAVDEYARVSGHTVQAILLASYSAVLRRYTGENDIVLLVARTEGAHPVRLDVPGSLRFEQLVQRADAALSAARTHLLLPPEILDGNLGEHAFECDLRVLFSYSEGRPPVLPGGATDIAMHVRHDADRLTALLDFRTDRYDRSTAEQLLGHVETLLEAGVATPEQEVAHLPLLTDAERRQLLVEWNATAAAYPRRCTHELVRDQGLERSEQVAVECGDEQLTYGALLERSELLARHLRSVGVGPEVLVGVCCERSIEMVVALLGIWRAGAAYVPIDPDYPAERQTFMLEDAGVPVVVSQARVLERLPDSEATVVCLDRDWPQIEGSLEALPEEHDPDQLAYVIYTSGSTGKPKGVQISHSALVNLLWSVREAPGFGEDDVLQAVTTLSFDIAGLELYLPLVCGGRLVLASSEAAGDPRRLASMLERHGATVMQATPTTWRMLVDSGWDGRPGLKALCGGEALAPALAEALLERGVELWNMYGPTETTIWSTLSRVEPGAQITIGRPLRNTSLYVLDQELEPVPIGVPGELCIGGQGLARGYLNRAELTAERFVENPVVPGTRIYRTGDQVRYRADGTVEFFGRLDHQVKVRGFRIELGEIETLLTRHPSISEAVAVAREDRPGDARLVAYYVSAGDAIPSSELRALARGALPPYMIPSAFVRLDAFPLTPNGKIDRKALPAPARDRPQERAYIGPRTPLERSLVDIWEEVLDIHPIGVRDDFFSLGATSIVAAQLFARIEQTLGEQLPLAPIFRAPTIEQLAELIEQGEPDQDWTSLVPIQPYGSEPPFFCVHGGAGTVLHLQPLARALGPEQPFYGLQARGLYGHQAPLTTVEAMAAHYLRELRDVQAKGPYYLGGYCFGGIVAFEMAQQLLAGGEDVALLAMFNSPSPSYIGRYGAAGQHRQKRPQVRLTRARRVQRLASEPWRVLTWAAWLWADVRRKLYRARLEREIGKARPVKEGQRDWLFLLISLYAEVAYEPRPLPEPIVQFHGAGLYAEPTLGWGQLAENVVSYEVPGVHPDNREAMKEPHVSFVAEKLDQHLDSARARFSPPVGDVVRR